jgi:hypothetical protein
MKKGDKVFDTFSAIAVLSKYDKEEDEWLVVYENGDDVWVPTGELTLVKSEQTETLRGGVLLEAKTLIEGDRNITYGEPTQNFTNIAGMWNILFAHKLKEDLTPADVAQAMIALKQCRMITEQKKRDSWVDLAGYAAIGFEAATAEQS